MRRYYPIIVLFIILFLAGCTRDISDKITEDDFPDPPLLTVMSSTVRNDMEISPDQEITLIFNNAMSSVNISISGIIGNTTLGSGNKSATFRPSSAIPEGTYTLTVTGMDEYGQEVRQDPIIFYVKKDVEIHITYSSFIAFSSNRDGDYEIFLIDPDSLEMEQLTNNSANDIYPIWSPYGDYIAFLSDREGLWAEDYDVFIMREDGSEQTNLTRSREITDFNIIWLWDGDSISFQSNAGGFWENYVIDIDGTNMRFMTEDDEFELVYIWLNHYGALISDNTEFGNYEIYLNGEANLTNNRGNDVWPSWSPDGQYVAFSSDRDANNEIYIMRSDGTKQKRLTFNPADDIYPCWSPF